MVSKALLTSQIQNWATPQDLYNKVNDVFNFNIDLAASKDNTKHKNFFFEEDSAIDKSWKGLVGWLNPPFDNQDVFIKKAIKETDCTIVMLLPVRTETKRWQEYVFPCAKKIIFLKGRLKFSESKNSSPFASALVIFSTQELPDLIKLQELGQIK